MTAASPAQPGWKGLVEVPVYRNSRQPEAWLPARPMAFTVADGSRPSRRAAARAAPNIPTTLVAWNPRRWNLRGAAAEMRIAVSSPTTKASAAASRSASTTSETASTAGSTAAEPCKMAAAWVSS